jgi:hypothetical protein
MFGKDTEKLANGNMLTSHFLSLQAWKRKKNLKCRLFLPKKEQRNAFLTIFAKFPICFKTQRYNQPILLTLKNKNNGKRN